MGGEVKKCPVKWVILPPLFKVQGGIAVCPRCQGKVVTTGKNDLRTDQFYVEHTPE